MNHPNPLRLPFRPALLIDAAAFAAIAYAADTGPAPDAKGAGDQDSNVTVRGVDQSDAAWSAASDADYRPATTQPTG
ncbi:hypothetical protein PV379_06340 [Streptomyces caniscabiei]|uniref:hypothetical protein n=1 Tax=Streptomyces caniscabiei TaxID=2746961 RepID=UPI0029A8FFE1|nr:hypothetical protein [Streptomyces caniscabiei]MDX2600862.1 hypothetical protein [Streptomyces caniscabiei]MDX2740712.1 hypothetical protein [Streptomyces caniscabiei]MDX2776942.1 hypothetical protein [Streptomyces caniscabiei]